MTAIKIQELPDHLLNIAVVLAIGGELSKTPDGRLSARLPGLSGGYLITSVSPAFRWMTAHSFAKEAGISTSRTPNGAWVSQSNKNAAKWESKTKLDSMMHCLVASVYGDEFELPSILNEVDLQERLRVTVPVAELSLTDANRFLDDYLGIVDDHDMMELIQKHKISLRPGSGNNEWLAKAADGNTWLAGDTPYLAAARAAIADIAGDFVKVDDRTIHLTSTLSTFRKRAP